MSAQNRCSSLLGSHRSAQNRCSSLLEGHKGASNRCSSLLHSVQNRRSSITAQSHCSKMLVSVTLCSVLPCYCSIYLRAWICTGSHLVSDISDDHIRGQYEGGMCLLRV